MDSLDEKVTRLSPEQRREVENFIDFLLQRGAGGGFSTGGGSFFRENSKDAVPHPIIMADEIASSPPEPSRDPLPVLAEIRPNETRHDYEGSSAPQVRSVRKDPGLLLDWID